MRALAIEVCAGILGRVSEERNPGAHRVSAPPALLTNLVRMVGYATFSLS